MTWPTPLGGKSKPARWLNKLLAAAMGCEIKSIIGGRLIPSSDGLSIVIDPAPTGSAPVATANGPLTSACWDAKRGMIFGVRAGYLFEFDATGEPTGRVLAYAPNFWGDDYIVLDKEFDQLLITHWCDPTIGEREARKGIFRVDPTTLETIGFIPFANPGISGGLGDITPNPIPSSGTITTIDGTGDFAHHLYFDLADMFPTRTFLAVEFTDVGAIGTFSQFYAIHPDGPFTVGPFDQDVRLNFTTPIGDGVTQTQIHLDGADYSAGFAGFGSFNLPAGDDLEIYCTLWVSGSAHDSPGGFAAAASLVDLVTFTSPLVQAGRSIYQAGPRRMLFPGDGNWLVLEKSDAQQQLSIFDPVAYQLINRNTNWDSNGGPKGGTNWYDLYFDSGNTHFSYPEETIGGTTYPAYDSGGVVWVPNGRYLTILDYTQLGFSGSDKTIYGTSGGLPLGCVRGFDYCPSNTKIYITTGTNEIATILRRTPYTVAKFSLSPTPAHPHHLRYVAHKSRIYIPTMQDNTVIELNPSTNTVTNIFTGFDLPWDIVTTSSAAWSSATTYAIGDRVTYGGINYVSLTINTDSQPDENPTDWTATGTAAVYAVQLGRLGLRLVV